MDKLKSLMGSNDSSPAGKKANRDKTEGARRDVSWRVDEAATRASLWYALGAIVVVVALAAAGRWLAASSRTYPARVIAQARKLVQNAAQRATESMQDENPLMALMHVNSAIAYVSAARRMVPNDDLARMTGVDIDELARLLDDKQLQTMQRLHQACPDLMPEGVFSVQSGWVG
jgi:hypothetical protein